MTEATHVAEGRVVEVMIRGRFATADHFGDTPDRIADVAVADCARGPFPVDP